MLTRLKKAVQSWVSSEAKTLHSLGVTPNIVSSLGFLLGILAGASYWAAGIRLFEDYYEGISRLYLLIAILLFLSSGFCDALDGALARLHNKISIFGGFLDSLLDRYVDAAIYCGLILGGLCDSLWGLLALIGSLLTSYTRARSEAADIPMESVGLFERAERILIIISATIIAVIWPDIPALYFTTIFLAVVTNITVLHRTVYFSRKVRTAE